MQLKNEPLKEIALASWYQGESLEEYLDAMFGYYDKENKVNEEAKGGEAPLAVMGKRYRSTFEAILAKFGLDLAACTFEEIISGDYYSVLRRCCLVDNTACNNPSFESLGGVI